MKRLRWCIKAEQWSTRISLVKSSNFHKWPKPTSIVVDEDNVKDLSTTEWRIIQEVGYGSPKRNCGKLFFVRRNRAQLISINNFSEIKPMRSNAISDLVRSKQEDETIDSSGKYRMKLKGKHLCWGSAPVALCASAGFIGETATDRNPPYRRFAGSSWDVPTSQRFPSRLDRADSKIWKL